jgi:hypothetical protein
MPRWEGLRRTPESNRYHLVDNTRGEPPWWQKKESSWSRVVERRAQGKGPAPNPTRATAGGRSPGRGGSKGGKVTRFATSSRRSVGREPPQKRPASGKVRSPSLSRSSTSRRRPRLLRAAASFAATSTDSPRRWDSQPGVGVTASSSSSVSFSVSNCSDEPAPQSRTRRLVTIPLIDPGFP